MPRPREKLTKVIPIKLEDDLIASLDKIVEKRKKMGRTIGNTRANLMRDFLWDGVEREEAEATASGNESMEQYSEDQKAILNLFEMVPDKSQFIKAMKSQAEEWIERNENFIKQATGAAGKPGKSSTGKKR